MTNIEKIKKIRDITMSPMSAITSALKRAPGGDIDEAIKILLNEKQADATDMANRVANASIVYSYVHNNKVGAMIVLACQTDFTAKNELFLNLAKDICMHIVSTPNKPLFVSEGDIDPREYDGMVNNYKMECKNKPPQIIEKIVDGKMQKYYAQVCLVHQPFVKDDKMTIKQLIQNVSATVGEKIEVNKFVKVTTNE